MVTTDLTTTTLADAADLPTATKTCTACGQTRALTEYHRHVRKANGLRSYCKACARAQKATYRAASRGKGRAYTAASKVANPDKAAAIKASRRARRRQALPAWSVTASSAAFAREKANADRLASETGIPFAVDHLVPLAGRYVSGLHVPENFEALPARANGMKLNKWDSSRHHHGWDPEDLSHLEVAQAW